MLITPGSPLAIPLPFQWHATVREKATGKIFQYWMNGSHSTREDVAIHIATKFRNVEAITIERAKGPPERPVMPVPPSHYECGIRERIEKEVVAERERKLGILGRVRPIAIKPLNVRPILNPTPR